MEEPGKEEIKEPGLYVVLAERPDWENAVSIRVVSDHDGQTIFDKNLGGIELENLKIQFGKPIDT